MMAFSIEASVHMPFGGTRREQRRAPDGRGAVRHQALAGLQVVHEQSRPLPCLDPHRTAREALAAHLDVDDRRSAIVHDRGVRNDDSLPFARQQHLDVVCHVASDRITVLIGGARLLEYTGDMSALAIPPGSKFTPAKPFFYAQEGGINVLERWSVSPLRKNKP